MNVEDALRGAFVQQVVEKDGALLFPSDEEAWRQVLHPVPQRRRRAPGLETRLWPAAVSPTGNSLRDVTYGGGQFVAVGDGGTILTSPDGLNWTERTSGTALEIDGVVYGEVYGYVAVGGWNAADVLISTDGVNWTEASPPDWRSLEFVTYGAGLFVTAHCDGTCTSSLISTLPDGSETWDTITIGPNDGGANRTYSGVYTGGRFVLGGYEKVVTSDDGINWTVRPTSYAGHNPSPVAGLAYGGGYYVGIENQSFVNISGDGENWTPVVAVDMTQWWEFFSGIAYNDGRFVVVGNGGRIWTASADADLGALTVSQGTLTPAFAADTLAYTVSVGNSVSNLEVTATTADAFAAITIDGTAQASGTARSVSLNVGDNPITIVVTAEDGTTSKTYTVTVTRASRPSGGSSGPSTPVRPIPLDPEPPFWPAGSRLMVSGIDRTSVTLTWPPARDNVGVTAYRLYRDGAMVAQVASTHLTHRVTGLRNETRYVFRVEAGDARGNWSSGGPTVEVVTGAPPPPVFRQPRPVGPRQRLTIIGSAAPGARVTVYYSLGSDLPSVACITTADPDLWFRCDIVLPATGIYIFTATAEVDGRVGAESPPVKVQTVEGGT